MSVSGLSNRSLATLGGVGAFATVAGGAVYFKAVGTVAVVGGIVAIAGTIAVLAAAVFVAYPYYDESRWKKKCEAEGIPPIEGISAQEAYKLLKDLTFGPKQFREYLGVEMAQEAPRLKRETLDMIKMLRELKLDPPLPNSEKPYRLIYLPKEIRRTNPNRTTIVVPTTINLLGELVQAPVRGHSIKYSSKCMPGVLNQLGNGVLDQSDWVLITIGLVQGTRNFDNLDQVALVSALGQGARPPTAIETIALNFFNHVRFGTCFYGQEPPTISRTSTIYTNDRGKVPLQVGIFCQEEGLFVGYYNVAIHESLGMAAAFSCGSSAANGS